MSTRTLEQRIKFDHGLAVGRSLVTFTFGERSRLAVVEIGPRGRVSCLTKPAPEDMYTSWFRVRGDKTYSEGPTLVWAARDPELMSTLFDGEPVASIPVRI